MKSLVLFVFAAALTLSIGCGGGSSASSTPHVNPPAAPTSLTATATDGQVALSWGASAGATSYNLYYATTTGVTTASGTKIPSIATNSYTQTKLKDGTTYYYIVTAVNAGGESLPTAQASAEPIAPIAAAPKALAAVPADGKVALTWNTSTGATSYNVYYSTVTPLVAATAKVDASVTSPSYTVAGLTDNTIYYFAVTAVDSGGESGLSNQATATPTNGITVILKPANAASGTLQVTTDTSLSFSFASTSVSQFTLATIFPVTQADLPLPLTRSTRTNGLLAPNVTASDTFLAAFEILTNPTSVTTFKAPVVIGGTVGTSLAPKSTINLAHLQNGAWVDVATIVVTSTRTLTENLVSYTLPGLTATGTYLLYQPALGTNTTVSNLGAVLIDDDGLKLPDGNNGVQVIHLYDATGKLLATPTISYVLYPGSNDLDDLALTPDGAQGIIVDGGHTERFITNLQTGTANPIGKFLDITSYGGDSDSVSLLPNGDEGVLTPDSPNYVLYISGILTQSGVVAATIPTPAQRDSVVISNDGNVMLLRGSSGLTVYSIAQIPSTAGPIAGTISHAFTQQADFPALGANQDIEDGREGMAISPADSSRAVVVTAAGTTIQLLTKLPSATTIGPAITMPVYPTSVSISPDGKYAVVGGTQGLAFYKGVDTGTLKLVGTLYAPQYTLGTATVTTGAIATLGFTLDNKYVVAADSTNKSLLVIPFTSAGFAAAPAAILGGIAVPTDDQLIIH